MALPCSAPWPTFSRRESRQRYARNLLVPGPPAQGGEPPWIPPPPTLAVLVVGKKACGILEGNTPTVPRIESRGCSLEGTKGKNKDRFAHPLKVANRSLFVVQALSRGCGLPQGERSVPLRGIPKGTALGAPLVTFPATGKSPGCRAERLQVGAGTAVPQKPPGWRGGAPSSRGLWGPLAPTSGSAEGQRPSHRQAESRGEKGGKYKREEPNGSSLLS